MLEFFIDNWDKLFLILVGMLALVIYYLQNRQKRKEAASLIVLQINELSERIREISGYTSSGVLDATAFYESLPLLEVNYWNNYKHYFVNTMDANSFSAINQFYSYALEINEQQMFMKALQKNGFLLIQQAINNLEFEFIRSGINNNYGRINLNSLMSAFDNSMPPNMSEENKKALIDFSKLIIDQNPGLI